MPKILFKPPSLFSFSTDKHIIDNNFKSVLSVVSLREREYLAVFNMFDEPKGNKGKREYFELLLVSTFH